MFVIYLINIFDNEIILYFKVDRILFYRNLYLRIFVINIRIEVQALRAR